MTMLIAKGFDRFVDSFDAEGTADLLLDNGGAATIEPLGDIHIYGIFEKYVLHIESTGVDGDGLETFECGFIYTQDNEASYPFGLFVYAKSLGVQLSLDTLSHQLYVSGSDPEAIARVVLHPQFPAGAVPVQR